MNKPLHTNITARPWYLDIDPGALLDKYGCSSLYVTNEDELTGNLAPYLQLSKRPRDIHPAMKACNEIAIWDYLHQRGVAVDCCSHHEVHLARTARVPMSDISLYVPAVDLLRNEKDDLVHNVKIMTKILTNGGSVVVDDEMVLRQLEEFFATSQKPMTGNLFARVKFGQSLYKGNAASNDVTDHGRENSQFGFTIPKLLDVLQRTKLPFSGLHIHVGTNMDNLDAFTQTVGAMHYLSDEVKQKTSHEIEVINLGGGLGIRTFDDDTIPTNQEYADTLKQHMRKGLTYKFEPGNSLFASAGILLARVLSVKDKNRLADIRGAALKIILAEFAHATVANGKKYIPESGNGTICGNYCFVGDIVSKNVDVDNLELGSVVILPNLGSYSRSLFPNFNGHLLPPHVMIGGEAGERVINRGQLFGETNEISTHQFSLPIKPTKRIVRWEDTCSKYLHNESAMDEFTIVSFTCVGVGLYEIEFVAKTKSIPIVSMPFAMRIGGAMSIIAVHDDLGKPEKKKDVYAPHGSVTLNEQVPSNKRLKMILKIGGFTKTEKGQKGQAWYQFTAYKEIEGDSEWVPINPINCSGEFTLLVVE